MPTIKRFQHRIDRVGDPGPGASGCTRRVRWIPSSVNTRDEDAGERPKTTLALTSVIRTDCSLFASSCLFGRPWRRFVGERPSSPTVIPSGARNEPFGFAQGELRRGISRCPAHRSESFLVAFKSCPVRSRRVASLPRKSPPSGPLPRPLSRRSGRGEPAGHCRFFIPAGLPSGTWTPRDDSLGVAGSAWLGMARRV